MDILFNQITKKKILPCFDISWWLYLTCDAWKFQNMYKDNDPTKTFTW